jgi:hypothetical protein
MSDGLFNLAYADDLVLTFTDADPEAAVARVQEASDRISSWCDEVELTLNALKSVLVVFDYHKRSSPIYLYLCPEFQGLDQRHSNLQH